jgi:hypothetical protein
MGKIRNAYRILVENPLEMQSLGRHNGWRIMGA